MGGVKRHAGLATALHPILLHWLYVDNFGALHPILLHWLYVDNFGSLHPILLHWLYIDNFAALTIQQLFK